MRIQPAKNQTKGNYPVNIPLVSKTVNLMNGEILPGIDVETHCKITGFVAEELINNMKSIFQENVFPENCALLAACHDIGKISPSFQKMIHKTFEDVSIYPELKDENAQFAGRKENQFHAAVTQSVFESILGRKNKNLQLIEGMHHGFKPAVPKIEADDEWKKLRHNLLKILTDYFNDGKYEFPDLSDWNIASMAGGFITVSDWIASGGEFANLTLENTPSDEELRKMAKEAVEKAGYRPFEFKRNMSFEDVFIFKPRNAQSTLIENINEPGIYILEAPMGMGKTEAALYAAYKMIESGKNNGIYFALPTQLTSNKIFERVKDFLQKVSGLSNEEIILKLLHSSSWLETAVIGEDGDAGKSWFDDKKRGILAPFAVGTIDQALMAVMNVRHGMVRTFGLAGKVVILDEAHSYDSYTGTLMNELVLCLKKIGCTVIILSATLTASQKKEILGKTTEETAAFKNDYPLVTALTCNNELEQFPIEDKNHKNIKISFCEKMEDSYDEAIKKAENGEQVLFILNTVQEAQNVYKTISSRMSGTNVKVGLLHSRFTKKDRQINEEKWVSSFGKGNRERTKCGRILVGTQVLEQSLDIDADFLITQICPSDMLFQRLGRLWRHRENDSSRPECAECSAMIISKPYEDLLNEKNPFGLTGVVYSKYVLFRTLEQWKNLKQVVLPEDIRTVLEKTYAERNETIEVIERYKNELEKQKNKLKQMALICESTAINTMPETAAQTRYSEQDTCSVLLMKSFHEFADIIQIAFLDGEEIKIQKNKTVPIEQKRKIAKIIMEHTVSVAEKYVPDVTDSISIFSPYVYTGFKDSKEYPFRIAVLGDDEYLYDTNGIRIEVNGNLFSYNNTAGYQITRKDGISGKQV